VGVGGHQAHAGQAPRHEATEERQPARAVLGGHDVQAEDLPVTVTVHADGEQAVNVDHPALFPDLHRQRVGLDEPIRAGIQRPGAERLDLGVEMLRQLRHLGLGNVRHAQLLDEFVDPPRGHARRCSCPSDRSV
jgi:hypothetical protein